MNLKLILRSLRALALPVVLLAWAVPVRAGLGEPSRVQFAPAPGGVPLVTAGSATPILVDSEDWAGVVRVARDFQGDVERVSGLRPALHHTPGSHPTVVLLGTLGKSAWVDQLADTGRIDVTPIRGQWEAWITEVVEKPFAGIERAIVVVGSDKRGTIYGTYDLSEQIGVSPWYWWADVAPVKRPELHLQPGRSIHPSPTVKYRGIFLNDEAPALTGWANAKFGGLNRAFYTQVFELLLRLRANYLWPAMWSNAFNEDDPENPRLADEYGIVMGTSHHEPMLRAHQEWYRHGKGEWNYETNSGVLSDFWARGIRRNRTYESIITLGMRGDGDMAMSESANISLLETIVHDQRAILAREMRPEVEQIPQLWALYKEVQEYIERGMTVPDDVTLLWCDDNYGNLRRLPTAEERARPGGAGVYYHIDYVGWPRSYKWLNVTPISRIWEQMHLAHRHGADRIWIVNVGDLKPMEFPIEFFLRYAWAPERWPYERLDDFGRLWAEREFGPAHAGEIAALVAGYTKLNGAIKPEWLSPDVFSLVNYNEAERVRAAWKDLDERAGRLERELPASQRDAFFQLVLWPIRACAIANEMTITAGFNQLYAFQGRTATNTTAARVRELFQADAALTRRYNEELGNGRWRHFADQTHLGYAIWQQPPRNTMPAVSEVQASRDGAIGVAIEGARPAWPEVIPGQPRPTLPTLDSLTRGTRWVEVFNRGEGPVSFQVEARSPWLRVSLDEGRLTGPEAVRLQVEIDWDAVPEGAQQTSLLLKDERGTRVQVGVPVIKYPASSAPAPGSFVEANGYVAMEAVNVTRAVEEPGIAWRTLPDFGRTSGGITPFPVTAESRALSPASSRLEYAIHTVSSGDATIELTLSPTLAFIPGRGLRLGVSVDEDPPRIIDLQLPVGDGHAAWGRTVQEGVRKVVTRHHISQPGAHVVKVWRIDPAVVLQRVVLSFRDVPESYYGPPESVRY